MTLRDRALDRLADWWFAGGEPPTAARDPDPGGESA